MNLALLLVLMPACGALLDIQQVPWIDNDSAVFVADFDLDDRGEIGVLTRNGLEVHERNLDEPTFSIVLPDGTAAVDVVDADLDGTADVVAIAGEQILRFPLSPATASPVAIPCFRRENQYSQYAGTPFPGVLIVVRDKVPLVALPCADALELRKLDGELVDSYPIGMDAPRRLSLGQPFSVWTNQHAQLGDPEALEFRVSSVATYKPLLPDSALPLDIAEPSGRFGTPRQQREAATLEPDRWPWFPVNTKVGDQIRALYARADAADVQTAIRVRRIRQDTPETTTERAAEETGPVRQYPGLLLQHPEDYPDFNGDGFNDLLLWKAARLSPSVDNLARAGTRGTWPVQIIAHVYAPEKKRFEAVPSGYIALDVPLNWYIASGNAGPLSTVFLHDVNDDGKTDFGCLLDARTLVIWLSETGGFNERPDFEHQFPEPIESVVLEMDLEGQGRTTIALQSEHQLYIVRPDTPFSR